MPNIFQGGLVGAGLRAGQLIHRMTVIGYTLVDLPNGGQDSIETVIEQDTPCMLTVLDAEERVRLGGLYGEATHQIRAHFTPNVRIEHRLKVHDPWREADRLFDILSVTNVNERGREMQILTVERVS